MFFIYLSFCLYFSHCGLCTWWRTNTFLRFVFLLPFVPSLKDSRHGYPLASNHFFLYVQFWNIYLMVATSFNFKGCWEIYSMFFFLEWGGARAIFPRHSINHQQSQLKLSILYRSSLQNSQYPLIGLWRCLLSSQVLPHAHTTYIYIYYKTNNLVHTSTVTGVIN